MAKYYFTNKAVEDLTSIWGYTFDTWSRQQADTYYEMLILACERVSHNPNLGKSYDGITPNLLGIKVQRHIIFYRTTLGNSVEVTRILHERMDLKQRIIE